MEDCVLHSNEIPWRVEVKPLPQDHENLYGQTHEMENLVEVHDDMDKYTQWQTLCHEVFHVWQRSHDLTRKKLCQEDIASVYGPCLAAFLVRNWPVLDQMVGRLSRASAES